ncbi:MAG: AAA family ATPase [Acidobacteria bacterium]|nr:AAA family ATPase [Acidobacteriota bacterium]
MRPLHFLEIENFKRFGEKQRIELDHPTVLIGPNNCGKTTAIQALALWSQAVRTWYENKGKAPPKERTSTSLNRLGIVAVPVQRTRYFWTNTNVRRGTRDIHLVIRVGVLHKGRVEPIGMRFRNQGDDLVYCTPDDATLRESELIRHAAKLRVDLLYPMSGLETEEPVLQPGRIDVLLGQGQTAQVLRNLCLLVQKDAPQDWERIVQLMERLFQVSLGEPRETARGSIALRYRQEGVRDPLDISLAGRGFHQMLLLLAYLYSHRGSVLLIDEPDAHLEILRQKQVYVLLRELAAENGSQIILVTHSEVLLDEALDHNLTLLLGGKAEDLTAKQDIRNALQHYGTDSYVRARQCRHVLYLEGRTDLQILRALARRLNHPTGGKLDTSINTYYIRDNFPEATTDAEIARVERSFGMSPTKHFFALRPLISGLQGLAIRDIDGREREDQGDVLRTTYWRRYEAENFFVTPQVLKRFALRAYGTPTLFQPSERNIQGVLDELVWERVFAGDSDHFSTWKGLDDRASLLLWNAQTAQIKLSTFAEEFFRRLAERAGGPMLLRKGELHRLLDLVEPEHIDAEVTEKLDLVEELLTTSAAAANN